MQPLRSKTKWHCRKRANGKETGWYEAPLEVHEKKERLKTPSSVRVNAGETGEACRIFTAKNPFEDGQKESPLTALIPLWYIYLSTHAHIHSSGCPRLEICVLQKEVEAIDRRVTLTLLGGNLLLQSVVSRWFSTRGKVFDGLSGKIVKIKNKLKKKKTARDGKRSAMYRLNCPVKTKTTVV